MEEKDTQKNVTPPTSQPRSRKKFLLFMAITFANLFGVSAASIAWFLSVAKQANISAVSGDLNVEIQKVTAYKYVYPFYEGSTEYINYDGQGTIRGYVVEDASIEGAQNVSKNDVVFTLSNPRITGTCQSTPANASHTSVYYHLPHSYNSTTDVRYYLIGNSTFNAVSNDPWSTKTAIPFTSKATPTGDITDPGIVVENVVVSAGAEFIFFDAHEQVGTTAKYFTYTPSNMSDPRFVPLDMKTTGEGEQQQQLGYQKIKCLKSGVYNFAYNYDPSTLNYTLTMSLARGTIDDAVISNGILDTTKVSIDYYSMSDQEKTEKGYATVEDSLPEAIQEQNTMVIFDVELKYKNANPITAALKLVRDDKNSATVVDYSNTTMHTSGVTTTSNGNQIVTHRNPVNASDFYSFYALFAKKDNAFSDGWIFKDTVADMAALNAVTGMNDGDIINVTDAGGGVSKPFRYDEEHEQWVDISELTPPNAGENIWNAMHVQRGSGLVKFQNDVDWADHETFKTSIPCALNPKESTDSTLILPASGDVERPSYHCYLAIDYDYDHIKFFMKENRLGKQYYLDRDFGIYFIGSQVLEGTE